VKGIIALATIIIRARVIPLSMSKEVSLVDRGAWPHPFNAPYNLNNIFWKIKFIPRTTLLLDGSFNSARTLLKKQKY
jgi:hypothetical protein